MLALKSESKAGLQFFLKSQVKQLPDYLSKTQLTKLTTIDYSYTFNDDDRKKVIATILEKLLAFASHSKQSLPWTESIFLQCTAKKMSRDYINKVLAPVLLNTAHKQSSLFKKLQETCVTDLAQRTKVKPSPPKDWKRSVPRDKRNQAVWDLLSEFLQSPTQQVFSYQQNESHRSRIEDAIRYSSVDLKTETIKKGRPYTLKITKTQAAYEKDLKHWKEDVEILDCLYVQG